MTPHELNVMIEEHSKRLKNEYEHKEVLAYVNAKLARLEKFPQFEKVFGKKEDNKPQKAQTPEEMMAVMSRFNS